MNKFTRDIAEAIGCPEWTGTGCDGKDECYCQTAAERVLARRDHKHDWQQTDNGLIDRCATCGEERA